MARKAKFKLRHSKPRPKRDRLRSPSWRYEYCSKLVDAQRPPRDDDDRYVLDLYRLLKTIQFEPVDIVEQYKDDNPDIADSLLIYEHSNQYRTAIEARIMAGFSSKEIAEVLGRPIEVIEYYGKCFFDVEDKLDNTGYMYTYTVAPIMEAAPFSDEALWKSLALYGGREFITYLIQCTPAEVQKLMDTLFEQKFSIKALQSINGITPDKYNSIEMVKLGIERLENRKKLEAFMPTSKDAEYSVGIASMILKSMAYGLMTEPMLPADPTRAGQALTLDGLKGQFNENPRKLIENTSENASGH